MSTLDKNKIIKSLNRLDINRIQYEYIISEIKKLLDQISVPVRNSNFFDQSFFRARKFSDSKITNIKDLGAPPKELIQGFQRCNPPNTPMFYAASRKIAAILEINAEPGDIIYICEWIDKEKSLTNLIFSQQNKSPELEFSSSDRIVHKYLDEIFTKRIPDTLSNEYKKTAAIAQVLTKNFKNTDGRAIGLLHPSVVDTEKSYNIAFHANEAFKLFQPINAIMAKVIDKNDQNISIEILDNAINFEDSKIHWNGSKEFIYTTKTKFTKDNRKIQYKNK